MSFRLEVTNCDFLERDGDFGRDDCPSRPRLEPFGGGLTALRACGVLGERSLPFRLPSHFGFLHATCGVG
jgi:hypothetical protein